MSITIRSFECHDHRGLTMRLQPEQAPGYLSESRKPPDATTESVGGAPYQTVPEQGSAFHAEAEQAPGYGPVPNHLKITWPKVSLSATRC